MSADEAEIMRAMGLPMAFKVKGSKGTKGNKGKKKGPKQPHKHKESGPYDKYIAQRSRTGSTLHALRFVCCVIFSHSHALPAT